MHYYNYVIFVIFFLRSNHTVIPSTKTVYVVREELANHVGEKRKHLKTKKKYVRTWIQTWITKSAVRSSIT